jgi:hypothetical protein
MLRLDMQRLRSITALAVDNHHSRRGIHGPATHLESHDQLCTQ